MKCHFHNDTEAVGICENCGVAVCMMCGTLKSEKLLCPTCLKLNQKDVFVLNNKSKIDSNPKIAELISNFNFYVETGLNSLNNKWYKGVRDHEKVLKQIRKEKEISKLIIQDSFLQDVYNVLDSFGMSSRSAKIKSFQEFKNNIIQNKDDIIFLSKYELENLSAQDFESLKEPLLRLFKSMKIMESHARLVGFSKTMAHLVPDLIPPIDRQKIHLFFYGHLNLPYEIESEANRFWEILGYFFEICKEVKISKNNWKLEGFNSSVPKIIDNAIWGFMSLNKNKNSSKDINNFPIANINKNQKNSEKITTIKTSNVQQISESDSLVIKKIKEKLNASRGQAIITLYNGESCDIGYDPNGKGLISSKIPPVNQLTWEAFDAAVEVVIKNGGKAIKGNARSGKLGSKGLPLGSIEGYIAHKVHGVQIGESAFGPGFVIAAVLDWAEICHNQRGYLTINSKFMAEYKG